VFVWFPEGERSPSGALQRFRPGIGLVLSAQPARVVPVYIAGAFDALPRGRWWPRIRPITVSFGEPIDPRERQRQGEGDQADQRIAAALQDRVAALSRPGS
jgi:long-chain acyl-CoA synthetase